MINTKKDYYIYKVKPINTSDPYSYKVSKFLYKNLIKLMKLPSFKLAHREAKSLYNMNIAYHKEVKAI